MPRDFNKPLTEDELEGIRVIFQALPTYTINSATNVGFVLVSDMPLFFKRIGWERTEEQIQLAFTYWTELYGGKVPEDDLIKGMKCIHDVKELTKYASRIYDKNSDGYIQPEEFQDILDKIVVQFAIQRKLTFNDFLLEADTNRDGQVSLEECDAWIEKNM